MKRILMLFVLLVMVSVFGAISYGQTTRRSDNRQRRQSHRIHNGIKSGELTRRERRNIKHSYNRSKRYERHAKSDGKVTGRERRRLNRMENRTSRKIYRKKHNNRDRN